MMYDGAQNRTNSSQMEDLDYSNYVVQTIDPGMNLLTFTIFFCMLCTLFVPVFFVLRERPTKIQDGDQQDNASVSAALHNNITRRSFNRVKTNDSRMQDNKKTDTQQPSYFDKRVDADEMRKCSHNESTSSPSITEAASVSLPSSSTKFDLTPATDDDMVFGDKLSKLDEKKKSRQNRSWRSLYINSTVYCSERQTICSDAENVISASQDYKTSTSREHSLNDNSSGSDNTGVSTLLGNLLGIFEPCNDMYGPFESLQNQGSEKSSIKSITSVTRNNARSKSPDDFSESFVNCDESTASIYRNNSIGAFSKNEESGHQENSISASFYEKKITENSDDSKLFEMIDNEKIEINTMQKEVKAMNRNAHKSQVNHEKKHNVNLENENYAPDDVMTFRKDIEKEKSNDKTYNICSRRNTRRSRHIMRQAWSKFMELVRYDKESKEIMKLAVPFTIGEIIDAIFEMIDIALIGQFMGTRALSACIIAETMLDLTDEFVGGIIDASGTIIPQSVGIGNNYLAGQYLQITIGLYVFCNLPFIAFWWYWMYDIILWFGFDEEVAELGWGYTTIALVSMVINGIGESFETFFEVNGFQIYVLIFGTIAGLIEIGLFVLVLYQIEDLDLIDAAYFDLFFTAFFTVLMVLIPIAKGWMNEYLQGIFYNFAFKNVKAVKHMSSTSAPLCVGTLLAYGEWELLTIFAAFMGPAEVAAWGILGTIWDTFEASTEAIGDSAEVRVGYHLGKGDIDMAKTSAHKSLLWGTCIGLVSTIMLFALGNQMSTWFTKDELLQNMIRSVIPFIGLGNVTMTFGMLCWSILGAQGRYTLSTFISFLTSWGIVIPSSAIMTYIWKFNLKGLVASVIFGYTVTAATMTIIILQSDWEKASQSIIQKNTVRGDIASVSVLNRISSLESASSLSSFSSDSLSFDIELNDNIENLSQTSSSDNEVY